MLYLPFALFSGIGVLVRAATLAIASVALTAASFAGWSSACLERLSYDLALAEVLLAAGVALGGFLLRVFPDVCFPALSWFPGQSPVQLARWRALGNWVMSTPIWATSTSAVHRLTPGIVSSRRTASVKGARSDDAGGRAGLWPGTSSRREPWPQAELTAVVGSAAARRDRADDAARFATTGTGRRSAGAEPAGEPVVLVLNPGGETVPELREELGLAPAVGAPAVPVHGQELGERRCSRLRSALLWSPRVKSSDSARWSRAA